MKKFITLFFTVVLVIFSVVLVGCTDKKTSAEVDKSAPIAENDSSDDFSDAKENTKNDGNNTENNQSKKPNKELVVFADLSVKDAFNEINSLFEQENNILIKSKYAVSGSLAKKVSSGDIADVFVSSGLTPVDALIQSGNATEDQITDLMANSLVLIVPKSKADKIKSIDDLNNIDGNIAVAMDKDPVRQYTENALNSLNLMDSLKDRFIFADSSFDVVKNVDAEEAVAGFAYKTDANKAKNSVIVEEIGPDKTQGVVYSIVVLNYAKNNDDAHRYDDFLHSEKAIKILEKNGFLVQ